MKPAASRSPSPVPGESCRVFVPCMYRPLPGSTLPTAGEVGLVKTTYFSSLREGVRRGIYYSRSVTGTGTNERCSRLRIQSTKAGRLKILPLTRASGEAQPAARQMKQKKERPPSSVNPRGPESGRAYSPPWQKRKRTMEERGWAVGGRVARPGARQPPGGLHGLRRVARAATGVFGLLVRECVSDELAKEETIQIQTSRNSSGSAYTWAECRRRSPLIGEKGKLTLSTGKQARHSGKTTGLDVRNTSGRRRLWQWLCEAISGAP